MAFRFDLDSELMHNLERILRMREACLTVGIALKTFNADQPVTTGEYAQTRFGSREGVEGIIGQMKRAKWSKGGMTIDPLVEAIEKKRSVELERCRLSAQIELREIRRRYFPDSQSARWVDGPPQYTLEIEACLRRHFREPTSLAILNRFLAKYRNKLQFLLNGPISRDDQNEMFMRVEYFRYWTDYLGFDDAPPAVELNEAITPHDVYVYLRDLSAFLKDRPEVAEIDLWRRHMLREEERARLFATLTPPVEPDTAPGRAEGQAESSTKKTKMDVLRKPPKWPRNGSVENPQ